MRSTIDLLGSWRSGRFRSLQEIDLILISDQFHEKESPTQALADQGKRPQEGCLLARTFDDEQRVDGGEDFHGFGQKLVLLPVSIIFIIS